MENENLATMVTEDQLEHIRQIAVMKQALASTTLSAGCLLVILDLALCIPFSGLLVWINKVVLRAAGMEDFLHSERGLVMDKVVFVVCNVALIVMFAMQLGIRKKTSTEQLKVLIKVWEDEVKQLEDVKEAIRIEKKLAPKIMLYKTFQKYNRAIKVSRLVMDALERDVPLRFYGMELEERRRRSGGVPPETPKDVDAGFEKAIRA